MTRLSDIPHDPQRSKALEAAYRRGYEHGACHLFDLAGAGLTRRRLLAWLHKVNDWRYASTPPMTPPPTPGIARKGASLRQECDPALGGSQDTTPSPDAS